MKRFGCLIGLAASVWLVSTASYGQTSSSLTLYGQIDAAVSTIRTGSGTTTPGGSVSVGPNQNFLRLDSGHPAGSRWGVRGAEDLGEGLRAGFVVESGFAADTGTSTQGGLLFGRHVWAGLSSTSGWSVSAGRQYTPMDIALFLADATANGYWGQPSNTTGHGNFQSVGQSAGGGSFQSTGRADNSVLGTFTKWGITGRLMLTAGNENVRGTGRLINPSLGYVSGPLSLQVAYVRIRESDTAITATASPEWLTEWLTGGSYDAGFAKFYGAVYRFNGPKDRSPTRLSAAAQSAFLWDKQTAVWVGARIPISNDTLGIQVIRFKFDYRAGQDGNASIATLFYEHPLSKRTMVYGTFGLVNNDRYARVQLGSAIPTVPLNGYGADPSAASIGMRHMF